MLIGIRDDISNAVITLGFCFSRWLAESWQLSRRGATGELQVEFKFQRRSCSRAPRRACSQAMLSFMILPQFYGRSIKRLRAFRPFIFSLQKLKILYWPFAVPLLIRLEREEERGNSRKFLAKTVEPVYNGHHRDLRNWPLSTGGRLIRDH